MLNATKGAIVKGVGIWIINGSFLGFLRCYLTDDFFFKFAFVSFSEIQAIQPSIVIEHGSSYQLPGITYS